MAFDQFGSPFGTQQALGLAPGKAQLQQQLNKGKLTKEQYEKLSGLGETELQEALKTAGKFRPGYSGIEDLFAPGTDQLRGGFQLGGQEQLKFQSLFPGIQERYAGLQVDPRSMEAFRGEALREGPSAWTQMALQRQRVGQKGAISDLARQQAGAQAQSRQNLAMRGGLSSGARERLARQGQRDQMFGRAALGAQGQQQQLDILTGGEERRMGMLRALPGAEATILQPGLQRAGALSQAEIQQQGQGLDVSQFNIQGAQATDRFNIEAALKQKQFGEMAKLKAYEEAMKGFAAEKTAEATASAGKK